MNSRILLVEDNLISREFLHEALLIAGNRVDATSNLNEARRLAMQVPYALLLCDVHLPDAGPAEIFHELTSLPMQAGAKIVAITAETRQEANQELKGIGYLEVWGKPIEMAVLQNHVRRILGIGNTKVDNVPEAKLWDEAAALLAVGGNRATLVALRNMFVDGLPMQTGIIERAFDSDDSLALKSECHKLLAGCGFVGARNLGIAVRRLSEQPDNAENLQAMMREAEKCMSAI